MNWENGNVEGIHYSRFIASWAKERRLFDDGWFEEWLGSLIINGKHLTDVQIMDIRNLAQCGKLELETHAKLFRSKYTKER